MAAFFRNKITAGTQINLPLCDEELSLISFNSWNKYYKFHDMFT